MSSNPLLDFSWWGLALQIASAFVITGFVAVALVSLSLGHGVIRARLLVAEGVIGGLGVMMGRRPLMDRELADGTLVAMADRAVDAATAYWLVGAPDVDMRPDIVAFKRWVIEEVARLAVAAA